VVQIGLLKIIIVIFKTRNSGYLFSGSQDKKSNEVNRKPIIAVDKETEIEKRRKELAKQKEMREKQAKEEVYLNRKFINQNKILFIFRQII
jgi:5'-3' exonuclease